MGKRQSLADWASANAVPAGVSCWLCGIPERPEVEAAIISGAVTKASAVRWLRDACGYEQATSSRVDNHMANHVRRAT